MSRSIHPSRVPDSQHNTGMPELQRLHDEDEGTNRDSGLNMSFSSQHSLVLTLCLASSAAARPKGKSGNAAGMLTRALKSVFLLQIAATKAAAVGAASQHGADNCPVPLGYTTQATKAVINNKTCIRLWQSVSEVEVHSRSITSSSGSGVVKPVFGGEKDLLGFLMTSSGNNITSCRMFCIRLATLGEQSEVSGSRLIHFHWANTSMGTTKHRTTLVT